MTTYYINADSGDDGTGDGSSGNPWETLAHAYANSSATDTIQCQDSTAAYDWVSLTFSTGRTVLGNSTDVAAVVFDADEVFAGYVLSASCTFKYITFKRSWKISGSEISQFQLNGNQNSLIESCVIQDVKTGTNGNNNGGLCSTSGTLAFDATLTIENCLIHNLRYDGVSSNRTLIGVQFNSNQTLTWRFYNCTIYINDSTYYFGRFVSPTNTTPTLTMDIQGSIFVALQGGNLLEFDSGGRVDTKIFDYNCTDGDWDGLPSGTGNITSDPLFVDSPNGNFNLRPASPCIGTGVLV